MGRNGIRGLAAALLLAVSALATVAEAQTPSRNFAPGFQARDAGSRLVIIPADMELFSVSGGGVIEPRADWTDAAQKHFRSAVLARKDLIGGNATELKERDLDELGQLNALHGAVADAVVAHHMMKMPPLPTKNGALDWTFGEAVKPLRDRTDANYALFFWVRDSYASAERKAAMVAMALLGVAMTGGIQIGYASLVDLDTGKVLWFNRLARGTGDLREAAPAAESIDALLASFPAVQ